METFLNKEGMPDLLQDQPQEEQVQPAPQEDEQDEDEDEDEKEVGDWERTGKRWGAWSWLVPKLVLASSRGWMMEPREKNWTRNKAEMF